MHPIIVIAASAGGLTPLQAIITALPEGSPASVFVVVHIGERPSILPKILNRHCALPVQLAQNGARIEPGRVYVAPPGHHLRLMLGRMQLDQEPKVHHTRPAADPLFVSASDAYGEDVIGIVLSGWGEDGAVGLRVVKERGGTAYVQRIDEAEVPAMPYAALYEDHPDAFLPAAEIGSRIAALS